MWKTLNINNISMNYSLLLNLINYIISKILDTILSRLPNTNSKSFKLRFMWISTKRLKLITFNRLLIYLFLIILIHLIKFLLKFGILSIVQVVQDNTNGPVQRVKLLVQRLTVLFEGGDRVLPLSPLEIRIIDIITTQSMLKSHKFYLCIGCNLS